METKWNGRTGEYLRWLIGIGVAGLAAYVTAMGAIQVEVSAIKTRQDAQFSEVLRRLEILQDDVRELRTRP